jgi:hypothetical protein
MADERIEIARRADVLAARVTDDTASFADVSQRCAAEYQDLLRAVAGSGERFAFDRSGRPGAIAAVREALPLMERDLFDAVIDDHACEIAAVEEALYRLAQACRRRARMG